jgi:ATP-dependent RNA helicase DDX47/RRP3
MPILKKRRLNRVSDEEVSLSSKRPKGFSHRERKDIAPRPVQDESESESDSDQSFTGLSDKESSHEAAKDATDVNGAYTDSDGPKTFQDLGIIEQLCEACEKLGYRNPTPIQKRAIPIALQGRDLIGLAETGSGKTAAYSLPMLQGLSPDLSHFFN